MALTITEDGRVLLDDKDIGAVADAARNNVVTPSEVQAALLAMVAKLKDGAAVDKQNEITVLQVQLNEKAAALATAEENVRLLKEAQTLEDLAAAKADIERPEIDKKKAAADAKVAAAIAERAALDTLLSAAESAPK